MHIDYEISEQDYANAHRLALKKLSSFSALWSRAAVPWLGVIVLVGIAYKGITEGATWNFLPGTGMGFLMLSLPMITKWSIHKTYVRSANIHGRISLDVDDQGVRFQGSTSSTQAAWAHFSRFLEDKNSFLLSQNSRLFTIIPKTQLSPEQIAALHDHFTQHISRSS